MKKLVNFKGAWRWAREHPFTAGAFAFNSLFIGFICKDEPTVGTCMAILSAVMMAVVILIDVKKWAAVIVALLMAAQPIRTEPAPIVVGCLIVAVGVGIVGCRLNALCKKKFGTPATNAPPSELYATSGGDTEAAVTCIHHKKNCENSLRFRPGEEPQTAVSIAGRLILTPAGPEIEAMSLTMTPADQLLDRIEYEQRMAAMGLVPCASSGCASYARNGIPIAKEDSKISFGFENGAPTFAVSSDQPSFRVVIERSVDLQAWEAITYAKIPVGNVVTFGDDSEKAGAFYRMRAEP